MTMNTPSGTLRFAATTSWRLFQKHQGAPGASVTSLSNLRLPPLRYHDCCYYFTNADRMREDDPYAVLGLTYGDGCSVAEIKAAFRRKAKQLHPDVISPSSTTSSVTSSATTSSSSASPSRNAGERAASREFQRVLQAYETLTKVHTHLPGLDASKDDEWKTVVWRRSDRIAVNRTDVAGVRRVRPLPSPKNSNSSNMAHNVLGHPQRGGFVATARGEYLEPDSSSRGSGGTAARISSSVGRGQSKWVTQRTTYRPWKPDVESASE